MVKTVREAEIALEAAKAQYSSELEADARRSDGSGAQERRREEYQDSLRETVWQCERDLEEAKRLEKKATEIMTEQQMRDRIKLLADEIDANEEENRVMQSEIDTLYAKIDEAKMEK